MYQAPRPLFSVGSKVIRLRYARGGGGAWERGYLVPWFCVSACSKYNADTEPPTDEDEYINSVSHPELQTQLRWDKYLRRLRQAAWGDHINIQAIADVECEDQCAL